MKLTYVRHTKNCVCSMKYTQLFLFSVELSLTFYGQDFDLVLILVYVYAHQDNYVF